MPLTTEEKKRLIEGKRTPEYDMKCANCHEPLWKHNHDRWEECMKALGLRKVVNP